MEYQATNKQTDRQTAHGMCQGVPPTQMGLAWKCPGRHKNHIQKVTLTRTYAEKGSG